MPISLLLPSRLPLSEAFVLLASQEPTRAVGCRSTHSWLGEALTSNMDAVLARMLEGGDEAEANGGGKNLKKRKR